MSKTRKLVINRLDRIFSKYIRQRDTDSGYGKCCSCNKTVDYEATDAGHFINRRHMATRWRDDNVHLQCRSCNRFQEGNAAGYALFMINKYGQKHVEYLYALSREQAYFTINELELMAEEYKKKLRLKEPTRPSYSI